MFGLGFGFFFPKREVLINYQLYSQGRKVEFSYQKKVASEISEI